MCREFFCSVVGMYPSSGNNNAKDISSKHDINVYHQNSSLRRKDIVSPQSEIVIAFLNVYGKEKGL